MLQWILKNQTHKTKTAPAVIILLLAVFCFGGFLSSAKPVLATGVSVTTNTQIQEGLDVIQKPLGLPSTDIRTIIANIIRIALGFVGIIMVVLIMFGGYLYMTSGGNEEQISRAKAILKNATIGLAIILSAYSIVWFIMRLLGVNMGGGGKKLNINGYQNFAGSGALGRVIKDHYPERDQVGVPRNTKILITFRKPLAVDATQIKKDTFIEDASNNGGPDGIYGNCDLSHKTDKDFWEKWCDHLRTDNGYITITPTGTEETAFSLKGAAVLAPTSTDVNGVTGVFNIVIVPINYLGSSQDNIKYSVKLGNKIWLDEEGYPSAFAAAPGYYQWNFTCSTNLDLDPPYVKDVWPRPYDTSPKNTVIQVNFSEPVDPSSIQGSFTSYGNYFQLANDGKIYLKNSQNLTPVGNFVLTNGYRTLEFTPTTPCGTNACGGQIYCLPVTDKDPDNKSATNTYDILLKTAELFTTSSWSAIPFSGITDVAFNALDGNHNKKIEVATTAPPVFDNWKTPDNYYWNFVVENRLDISSPYLNQITPGLDAEHVTSSHPLWMMFSKRMRVDPLYDIKIDENPNPMIAYGSLDTYGNKGQCEVFVTQMEALGYDVNKNDCVLEPICRWARADFYESGQTLATIGHCPFLENLRQYYYPTATSTVEDVNFNCFYPGTGPGDNDKVTVDTIDRECSTGWTTQGCREPASARDTSLECYKNDPNYSDNCTGATTTLSKAYGCNGLVSNLVSTTPSCLKEMIGDSRGAGAAVVPLESTQSEGSQTNP